MQLFTLPLDGMNMLVVGGRSGLKEGLWRHNYRWWHSAFSFGFNSLVVMGCM